MRFLYRKSHLVVLVSAVALLPGVVGSAELDLEAAVSLRGFERQSADNHDETVLPLYASIAVEYGSLSEAGLSLHGQGWGRSDLADSAYYADQQAGELLYGFLQYTSDWYGLDLRLGRQSVQVGGSNESIDGLLLKTDISPRVSVTAYGGYPVALETTAGRGGDSIVGGRITARLESAASVGVSYKLVVNDGRQEEQRAAVDLYLMLPADISFSGISSLNLETENWAEHMYEATIPIADFLLRPVLQRVRYADYFNAGAKSAAPFRQLSASDETVTVAGGDLRWLASDTWESALRLKRYDYDLGGNSALYAAVVCDWHRDEVSSVGGELGRMDGRQSADRYLLGRLFSYWDMSALVFPHAYFSGDFLMVAYDEPVHGEDRSLSVSLTGGSKFLDQRLKVQLALEYAIDPYYDEDVRTMLQTTYTVAR